MRSACFSGVGSGKKKGGVNQDVEKLFEALDNAGLRRKKGCPRAQPDSMSAVSQYIQDLIKRPSKQEMQQHQEVVRLAIPSYVLEDLDPVVLIPRGQEKPLVVPEEDIKFIEALTSNQDNNFQIIINHMGLLTSDPVRRAAFLKWWDESPLRVVTYCDGRITAQTAYFHRVNGDLRRCYSNIGHIIVYLQSLDDTKKRDIPSWLLEGAKERCESVIACEKLYRISEGFLNEMNLTEAGKNWLQGWTSPSRLVGKAFHFDQEQEEIYDLLLSVEEGKENSEKLAQLLQRVKDPAALPKLEALLSLEMYDFLTYPSEKNTFYNYLPDLFETFPKVIKFLIDHKNILEKSLNGTSYARGAQFLIKNFGTDILAELDPSLAVSTLEVFMILEPLSKYPFEKEDVEICRSAIESWEKRESWSSEEIAARYRVLHSFASLVKCRAIASLKGSKNHDAIMNAYPVFADIYHLLQDFPDIETVLMPKNIEGLDPEMPFKTISDKMDALTKSLPKSSSKKNRLTLNEFYFVKKVILSNETPGYLTSQTWDAWKIFAETYLKVPKQAAVMVSFVNPRTTNTGLIKRIGRLHIGVHANISSMMKKGLVVYGVGDDGSYVEEINGFISPNIDTFELDLKRLARALPEEKQPKFIEGFHLPVFVHDNLFYPDQAQIKSRLKGLLRIQPKLDVKNIGFKENTSLCSEFVIRKIIQITVELFQELGESPPTSGSYFGLSDRENLELISPLRLQKCLIRKGLIRPINNIEQIIRFD